MVGVCTIHPMPSPKNKKYFVISFILFIVLGIPNVYSLGSESIKNQIVYQVTKNNEYVVVYTNNDKYILNSILIKDNKLIITNKTQMIVNCNNVKLTKRKFHEIEIRTPN